MHAAVAARWSVAQDAEAGETQLGERHAGAMHSATRHGGAARPGCSWHSDSTTLLLQQYNVFIFVELVEAPLIPKKVINVATDCCY